MWQVSVRNRPEERQTFAKRRKLKRKESIVNRKTAKKKCFKGMSVVAVVTVGSSLRTAMESTLKIFC